MKPLLLDWATRHNYLHHSNPMSKTRCKALFDKVHIRPMISNAWEIVKDESSDSNKKKDAWAILDKFDPKRNQSDNANMLAGRAVQAICDLVILNEVNFEDAYKSVKEDMLLQYQHREWDEGTDFKKYERYYEEVPLVAKNAIIGLTQALQKENKIIGETDYLGILPGNELPYNTKPDYARRGDLKTKWSTIADTKSGWRAASLPSSLSGPFELSHLYQVAGFWAVNGGLPPFLVYANVKDYRLFTQENSPELSNENLAKIVKHIINENLVTERFLKVCSTKEQLFQMVTTNYRDLCWKEPPSVLKEARKFWE